MIIHHLSPEPRQTQLNKSVSIPSETSITINDSHLPIHKQGQLFNLDSHVQLKSTTTKLDEIEPDFELKKPIPASCNHISIDNENHKKKENSTLKVVNSHQSN